MIYLLRHGLDDERYIGGWSNGKLLEEGIMASHKIAEYIDDNIRGIDKIISSDIFRACETTDIINSYLRLPVTYTKELRELDKGLLTGMEVSVAKNKYRDIYINQDINTKYPNGESMKDLYLRVKEYLNRLENLDNALLVTHRGVINMIYYILNDIPLDMNKERFLVTHSSLHELDIEKKIIKKIK